MNILHILPSVSSKSYGLGQVAINLMKAQRELAHNSKIWCFDDQKTIDKVLIEHNLPKDSIKGFGSIEIGNSPISFKIFLELFSTQSEFDIVHQHGIWTLVSLWTLLYSRRFKVKSIIAPHGSLEPTALKKSRNKKKLALLLYENANMENAVAFHATSKNEVEDFKKFGITKKIFLVNNGINKEWINTSANSEQVEEFCRKLSLDIKQRFLLYMSRVTPKKNLGALLNAWALIQVYFPEWHLVVIGADEMGYKLQMQNLVIQLGILERTTFSEPCFGQDRTSAFASAEIFVLPSLSEGFPIVILDSLGAGVPVLTTKASNWDDLEEHRCGWIVDPTDISLANKLKTILSLDKGTLSQMGANGKQLVTDKYLWDHMAIKVIDEYKCILES